MTLYNFFTIILNYYCIFVTSLLCSAGVAAGLLGIGGGMLKGPLMLEMGLTPPGECVCVCVCCYYNI